MNIMRTLTINGTKYNVTPVVPASSVTLLASAWMGSGDAYYQVVELPDVTPNTKVDLQPTSEQLAEFHNKVLAFVAENEGGVVTVYAIGDRPAGDHTIQTTLTEVEGAGKIRGNTVGTTMPRPDWNQTDPTKADYIKNKEAVDGHLTNVSNPHGVTAAQVGARPNTWTPTAADVGAAPASHATDKGNPHGVTAAQVGAVPASHATDKGNPHGVTAAQVGAVPAIESTDYPGCYYRMVGGNTEWINPPVGIGEEYRTTERWNGYAVYTKLIDLGIVPVGERDYDIGFYSGLIRHYAVTNTNRSVLTTGEIVEDWDVSVKIFQNTVRVTGGEGIGNNNETLYLQVWYTKP